MGNQEQKSNFWPIFIIVLAALTAGVWKLATIVDSWIPRSAIESIRDSANRNFRRTTETPSSAVVSQTPNTTDLQPTVTVEPCTPSSAAWGVLRRTTAVRALEGRKTLGTVKGGRFFKIARRAGIDGETVFVGNFTPHAMDEVVYVPEDAVFCFTGSPDDLTDNQRANLRPYFELEGEIARISNKYLRETAERSPYAKEAAEALKKLRHLQKTAQPRTFDTDDERRTAFYEISSLKLKVQELNLRHKEWKEQHAAELPDPEKDPAVRELRKRQQALRDSILPLLGR